MTKVLSKKSVLQAKWFDVYEVELELPNGEKRTHHDVIRKPSVSIFPFDEDYNLYLIDQYRYLMEQRVLETASGMMEDGEDPLQTAKRELKEETGITAKEWSSLGSHYSAVSIIMWEKFMYVVKGLKFGKSDLEATEDVQLVKIPLEEALEKVLSGEITSGSTAFGILMIDKLRQEGKI